MIESVEMLKCGQSCHYFIDHYYMSYDGNESKWVDIKLWPAQVWVLNELIGNKLVIVLKARQLGISTICLAYALWLMLFRPLATILLFSRRDDEAMELLDRLKKTYDQLPEWMRCSAEIVNNAHEWELSNGSRAFAFPTTSGSGRSLSATFSLVDEADHIPNLNELITGMKPTIDGSPKAKLAQISTVDKSTPLSTFKQMFRAGDKRLNGYRALFLPWWSRPGRTQAWYRAVRAEMFSQNGTDDDCYQEYPATVEEALSTRSLDKRMLPVWVRRNYAEVSPLLVGPAIPGFTIYVEPVPGRSYVIGADPAEGNPNSDDSAATVLDAESWEQVAVYQNKIEPGAFGDILATIAGYYNNAAVLPERNNHGHALILALRDERNDVHVLNGYDDKPGWPSTGKSKPLLYDFCAEALRDDECTIHHEPTKIQLLDLEAETLLAPEGLHDDCADALALALMGCKWAQANELVLRLVEGLHIAEDATYDGKGDVPVWSLFDSYVPGVKDEFVKIIIMGQVSDAGVLTIFNEATMVGDGTDKLLEAAMADNAWPDHVVTARNAKEARKTLLENSFYVRSGPGNLADGVRNGRRLLFKVRIHPRCETLIRDLSRWRFRPNSALPALPNEHGGRALLNLLWAIRHEMGSNVEPSTPEVDE